LVIFLQVSVLFVTSSEFMTWQSSCKSFIQFKLGYMQKILFFFFGIINGYAHRFILLLSI